MGAEAEAEAALKSTASASLGDTSANVDLSVLYKRCSEMLSKNIAHFFTKRKKTCKSGGTFLINLSPLSPLRPIFK